MQSDVQIEHMYLRAHRCKNPSQCLLGAQKKTAAIVDISAYAHVRDVSTWREDLSSFRSVQSRDSQLSSAQEM